MLSLSNINNLVNQFWLDIFVFNQESSILLMVKIDFGDGFIRSFCKITVVNYEDKNFLLTNLKFYFELYNSHYTNITPENLVIVYKIIPKRTSKILKVKYNHDISNELMLPSTMDLYLWSSSISFNKNYSYAHYVKDGLEYSFELSKTGYICTIKNVDKNVVLYSFTDRLSSKNCELDCFTRYLHAHPVCEAREQSMRTFNNKTYHYVNGEQVFYEEKLESVYIQPRATKSESKNKFLTLDTETRKLENGDLEVISIALYDGCGSAEDYKT
jgi:hypothetical protein